MMNLCKYHVNHISNLKIILRHGGLQSHKLVAVAYHIMKMDNVQMGLSCTQNGAKLETVSRLRLENYTQAGIKMRNSIKDWLGSNSTSVPWLGSLPLPSTSGVILVNDYYTGKGWVVLETT